ncbi:hypothetical protein TUM4438_29850 [Shewanella sairae]|uniref:Uncharacterized protein n=1 Tax=Shewanella sairae TaxID=190310 RepID=A0ABQ4PKJ1_9GAMM|nr:hypothetical protein [Shewanella sairae]MCL1131622.1 hypothetical protein [Shewanella sairae]GIU48445.1 hypothetical protein TUM4438_29850 [Shewanella sairae]
MINNRLNKQQVITAAILMLLVAAVQVSTERAGDWMFIGLNLIEIGSEAPLNLGRVSEVSCFDVQQLIVKAIEWLLATIN